MQYFSESRLRDGRTLVIRGATVADAEAGRAVYARAHEETDYLLKSPEEAWIPLEDQQSRYAVSESGERDGELLAFVDGELAGMAGLFGIGSPGKISHRAEYGISILESYWRLGIGRALTEAIIECARTAGYTQLELEVVADNTRAIALYESLGFTEYGRNPRGFRTKDGSYQELVLMRNELE